MMPNGRCHGPFLSLRRANSLLPIPSLRGLDQPTFTGWLVIPSWRKMDKKREALSKTIHDFVADELKKGKRPAPRSRSFSFSQAIVWCLGCCAGVADEPLWGTFFGKNP